MKDVQINQTLEAKNGNIVMKFESNSKLIEAKKKLDESKEEWFEPMVGTKLNPKIRICNVPKQENTAEAIAVMLCKNSWLNNAFGKDEELEQEFKMVAVEEDRTRNVKHYIIKCSPRIRNLLHKNRDEIFTEFVKCNIKDKYHVWQCYRCQGFGHKQNDNKGKPCELPKACPKCTSSDHDLKDCTDNAVVCCVNCKNAGISDPEALKHRANSFKCPKFKDEITKIINKTDHGY